MKPSYKHVFIVCLLSALALNSFAQKAALYNLVFQIPDEYRKEIQAYDPAGNKKYKKDLFGDDVLDKSPETLSKKEVNAICSMLAEMFKRKYRYEQVTIMYPLDGDNGVGRLKDFPNLTFKKAVKKLKADAYIFMNIILENKEPLFQGSDALEILNIDSEKIMIFNVTASYIVFDQNEKVIDQKAITLSDFTDELNKLFESYRKEVDDKGRYRLWKAYFTKDDINAIYKITEQKLEAAE